MNSNRLISTLAVAAFLYVGSLAFAQNGSQGTYQDQGDRGSVTVPAGTEISVRTNEAIDSQNASEGQHYSATVLQDIRGGAGETLISKDSNADLVIRRVNSGGTVQSGNVVLDLDSITVNGRRYRVSTEDLKQSGSGESARIGAPPKWWVEARLSAHCSGQSPEAAKAPPSVRSRVRAQVGRLRSLPRARQ